MKAAQYKAVLNSITNNMSEFEKVIRLYIHTRMDREHIIEDMFAIYGFIPDCTGPKYDEIVAQYSK